MPGDFLAYGEDMCSWGGNEVHFLHEQLVPPVVPLGSRHACTLDRHPALRQVSDVIVLSGSTEVLPDAEMQDEVLNRVDEATASGVDERPYLVWGASSERRLHTDEDVIHPPQRLRVRPEHITIAFS